MQPKLEPYLNRSKAKEENGYRLRPDEYSQPGFRAIIWSEEMVTVQDRRAADYLTVTNWTNMRIGMPNILAVHRSNTQFCEGNSCNSPMARWWCRGKSTSGTRPSTKDSPQEQGR